MKPTASSRSLTNHGANTQSARSVVASPLAPSPSLSSNSSMSRMSPSGKKSRRANSSSSDNKPPGHYTGGDPSASTPLIMAASSHDLLYQLQQLQHHQQHQQQQQQQQQQHHQLQLQQHTMAGFGYPALAPPPNSYAPPYGQPPRIPNGQILPLAMPMSMRMGADPSYSSSSSSTSSAPAATENGEELLDRIEKKDQMIAQLGSFLTQMKHESEGTAHAWKEKMQEIGELKRQVAALTQQLHASEDKQRATADQLAQVTEDVELAVHGLQECESKHREELQIMNEELQRRQHDQDQARAAFDEKVALLSEELRVCQSQLQDAATRNTTLESTIQQMETSHCEQVEQLTDQARVVDQQLMESRSHVESVDKEKQELAHHLWNVTQALDQTTSQERSLQSRLEQAAEEMEQRHHAWSEQLQQLQNERDELLTIRTTLESTVQTLTDQVQEERSQKEQINALMGDEMQRITHEIQQLHTHHASQLQQHAVEIDHWKTEATSLQDKLVRVESQYVVTRTELDEWQARASQIDQENQLLQKHGSEKSYTLQELNEQLRTALNELQDTRAHCEQLRERCSGFESGATACLQLLSSHKQQTEEGDGEDEQETAFPGAVVRALEQWTQQAGQLEQLKISMLRLQQDRDSEREKAKQREHELTQKALGIQGELDATRGDATALAKEIQELTQRLGGNETKLAAQLQQLTKELDESRASSALQILQLQKGIESQKARVQQLESDKRELLHEAETLNSSMEVLYQNKNEKQVELDQLKATYKELHAEHADLKESFEDLETNYDQTTTQLNQKAKELQTMVQELLTAKERLTSDLTASQETLSRLQTDHETLNRQYLSEQTKWSDTERETQRVLEEKIARLDEMMEMLTQLRSRNEFLEQARASDDQSVRLEFDKFQSQLLSLTQDKKRGELTCANLKTQLDTLLPELFTLKEEKRQYVQVHGEMEAEIGTLKAEIVRLQAETERLSRARSSLQLELNRVTDDGQDVVRQFEVLRRDVKLQERQFHDDHERLRKEIEELRSEASESAAMVEELQTKMTSVQQAANATINELLAELQNAQDTLGYDKTKFQKECESLKNQVQTLDDESRRKDAEIKQLQIANKLATDQLHEKENELSTKLSRVSSLCETKKHEVERLSKELETKAQKVAEYERKLHPLVNTRDSLQAKCVELKQTLDTKLREWHDLEERHRDEVARAVKDKREMETMYLAMKEDYDMTRSQSTGQQQQWQSELRTAKQTLERTKAELMRASGDVLSLSQRLESNQLHAQETITELATRLQAADQQKEMAVLALQREIHVERDRRRETEVQKMELQRQLRQYQQQHQRGSSSSQPGPALPSATEEPGSSNTWSTPSSHRSPPIQPQQQQETQVARPSGVAAQGQTQTQTLAQLPPPEYRKFYANEPMTNAELANLPMDLIKAQMGLDMAGGGGGGGRSPAKANGKGGAARTVAGPRATTHTITSGDNNDDIPLLALEKLPQSPEATDGESSPTCDTSSSSSRLVSDKRSGAISLLDALSSSRSNGNSSDRYLAELSLESSSRPQRNSSSSSLHSTTSSSTSSSSSNNKKKLPSASSSTGSTGKKKRPSVMPSSSSVAAASSAYSAFSSLQAPTPSPPKMKSNSKLLPRIQQ